MNKRKKIQPKKKSARPGRSTRVKIDLVQIGFDQHEVEQNPSVEWGDRLHSGKTIARGGSDSGYVPGAMPSR